MRSALRFPPSGLSLASAVHAASRRSRAVTRAAARARRSQPGDPSLRSGCDPLSAFRRPGCRWRRRSMPLRGEAGRSRARLLGLDDPSQGIPPFGRDAIRSPLSAVRAVAGVGGPCRFAEKPGGHARGCSGSTIPARGSLPSVGMRSALRFPPSGLSLASAVHAASRRSRAVTAARLEQGIRRTSRIEKPPPDDGQGRERGRVRRSSSEPVRQSSDAGPVTSRRTTSTCRWQPIFARMCFTCVRVVSTPTPSTSAISRGARPSTRCIATFASVGVSP